MALSIQPSTPTEGSTRKNISTRSPEIGWSRPRGKYPIRVIVGPEKLKVVIREKSEDGIIDVYSGKDPPFSPTGLSFLEEFQKRHSATNLYEMVPEYREIVELALKNPKAEEMPITKSSYPATKALYLANREARAKGFLAYKPNICGKDSDRSTR
ncbi:unnamed protein product [Prunus armeniaca]